MNYIKITSFDTANGPGIRDVLWVAGCNHCCKEGQNPETWDKHAGKPFDEKAMNRLMKELSEDFREGITFSGGDPLFPENREKVTEIARKIYNELPTKSIWLYTGYLYEQVKDLEIMEYIDVLVDGEFHIDEKDLMLVYCGSRNQRVIDVQKTRDEGKIVLYC